MFEHHHGDMKNYTGRCIELKSNCDNCKFIHYLQIWRFNIETLWLWNVSYTSTHRLYCTSALKPSSSGTRVTALHRIRENKGDSVIMIWVQGCWDAIFFTIGCLWSPDGSSELWKMRWQKQAKQLPPCVQDTEQSARRVYSSLYLIAGSATSELSSHFGVGSSEASNRMSH